MLVGLVRDMKLTTEHTDHTDEAFVRAEASQRDSTTYRILGAFFGVYRILGWGFLESVYRRSMAVALQEAGARVIVEAPLPVHFSGQLVGEFRADLIVDNQVIVELKAAGSLAPEHRAQVINYLKASTFERGLLLNFGPKPAYERILLTNDRKEPRPLRF